MKNQLPQDLIIWNQSKPDKNDFYEEDFSYFLFELLHYKQHPFHPLPIRQAAPAVLEVKSDFHVQTVDDP